jgi:flagellar hook-associated protein 3 FlgL
MSLRVPDAQTFASGDLAIKRTRAKMSEAVRDTSTGKKIHHPWDDPAAAGRAALHTAAAQRLNSVSASAMRARDDLQHADVALGEVGDWLARARELAVQMANDSMSPEDRAHAADEVASLRDGIIDVLNRRVAGRYIFAGNLDNAPPSTTSATTASSVSRSPPVCSRWRACAPTRPSKASRAASTSSRS